MANPLLFDQYKDRLNKVSTPREVEVIITEIGDNRQLGFENKLILIENAKTLLASLKRRDASLEVISQEVRTVISTADLTRLLNMIKSAVSTHDKAASIMMVRRTRFPDPIKDRLIVIINQRKALS